MWWKYIWAQKFAYALWERAFTQGLQHAGVRPLVDFSVRPHASPLDSSRKPMSFSGPQPVSDVHTGSFESIGSHLGNRVLASHSSSHDSENGGVRTGKSPIRQKDLINWLYISSEDIQYLYLWEQCVKVWMEQDSKPMRDLWAVYPSTYA